jgi:hypothetical protein
VDRWVRSRRARNIAETEAVSADATACACDPCRHAASSNSGNQEKRFTVCKISG